MYPKPTEPGNPNSHKILIGDLANIRIGIAKSITLIYSGMPNEETFAVTAVISEAFFLDGFKFTSVLYYPKHSKVVKILDYLFDVEEVTSHQITLSYRKVKS